MRLLELFSRTTSVSKVAKAIGAWETISLDIDPKFNPDLCMGIMDFDEAQYSKDYFSFVWASPDCRAYSVARTNAKIPRDEAMATPDVLVEKTSICPRKFFAQVMMFLLRKPPSAPESSLRM